MSRMSFDQLLSQRLLSNQQLDPADLDRALAIQREKPGSPLGEILIGMNALTREALTLAFLQLYAQVNASDSQRVRWGRGYGRGRMPESAIQPTA